MNRALNRAACPAGRGREPTAAIASAKGSGGRDSHYKDGD